MELGKFQKLELRDYWADEAREFTPWLARDENIKALGEAIGIDIDVEGTEKFIGSFKADIIGKNSSSNEMIIIENQLEKSDHDHLGKIITYASGIGASIIVWICKNVTEEHRQAVDWLNENTNTNVNFFVIEMELWKIDDSKAAPRFNIICKPNKWAKTTKEAAKSEEMTEGRSLQFEYWTYLKDYIVRQKTILPSLQTPRAQHWFSISIGRSGFIISLTMNTRVNSIGCELFISGERAKEYFFELKKDEEAIEREVCEKLDWQELPNAQSSRIAIYREVDIWNREQWEEVAEWHRKYSELFYKAFSNRIRDL